jgi:hypothetical protein
MHRILVLWDHATIMARLGTMLIGVPGSRQIKLRLQAHNQNLNHNANNSATTPARQNQAHAHVNHVVVEDVQAAPVVIIGMILVNGNNAIVLFDSKASHSFVAGNFVQKHNLPLSMLNNRMIASSPGGDMHARLVSPKVSILRRGGGRILSQPHSSGVKRN